MRRRRRRSNRPRKRTLHGVLRPLEGELYPRCAGCGYSLEGLPESRCPECGCEFDTANPATFELTPPLRRGIYWLPGVLLAAAVVGVFAAGFWLLGWVVPGLVLGVTVAAGAVLGYGTRLDRSWGAISVFPIVGTVGITVFSGEADTWAIGAVAGLVLALPYGFGLFLGTVLRGRMKLSRFDQRWHLP